MNNKKKNLFVIPCSILALTAVGYTGYEYGKSSVENNNSNIINNISEPKKIAYADKISDIVVTEITEDGYVTLHGDHSHYEKGLVPYNAKFLDKLVFKDKNYKLKDEDIQYEVAQGYIIKVNGKYYYYPKDGVAQSNVVDEETAKTISASSHHHHHEGESSSHSGDNYTFNPKDIVKETDDGYVVRHGDHYHFIKKSELSVSQLNAAKEAGVNHELANNSAGITHATSDGYIFKGEGDIIGRNSFGFIVQHGSHSHIIPYDSLRGTKWEYLINSNTSSNSNSNYYVPNHRQIESNNNDNYTFNQNDIVAEDENGYTVRHNDHYHYIPKNNQNNHSSNNFNNNPTPSTKPTVEISKDIQEKIDYLAKLLNIDSKTIKVIETTRGKALVYPHGDHSHTVFLDEIHINGDTNIISDDIEKQKDYIAEVYGVPREAIRVTNDFFIFNEPTQEYDPTHIHPYLIPRNKFRIPEVTGDKELDFEQELLALSERTGIDPDKIKVEGDKFVIPHGSHNHYVKIKSGGAEIYLKNKIPNIIGAYIDGAFNKDEIINKINSLITANNALHKDTKVANRINRALNQLKSSIENETPTNSTKGYLTMLENFDKKYIHIDENNTSIDSETFINIYNKLLTRVKDSNIEHLGLEKEVLIEELNVASSNHNEDTFNRIEHLLNELEKFDSQTGPTILSYVKYFLENINSSKIDNELREELAYLVKYAYLGEAQITDSHAEEIIARLINAKNKLHYQLANNETHEVKYGENYSKLNEKYNSNDEKTILDGAKSFIKDIEEVLPTLEFSKTDNKNELTTKINSEKIVIKHDEEDYDEETLDNEESSVENSEESNNEITTNEEITSSEKENNVVDSASDNPETNSHDKIVLEENNHIFDFNETDVLEETATGFIVKHGNHNHFVYKKDLTDEKIKKIQDFLTKNK